MALPTNVMRDQSGKPLKFFSPFPTISAAGTNVFSQQLISENAYVFPPFVLIGPLLKFLHSQRCPFSIVVPDLSPHKYWWPLLTGQCSAAFLLGKKGENNILLFPSQSSCAFESRPLQWDLWVFRIASR